MGHGTLLARWFHRFLAVTWQVTQTEIKDEFKLNLEYTRIRCFLRSGIKVPYHRHRGGSFSNVTLILVEKTQ